MRYSLLDQFSGAWLGAFLGEALGRYSQQHQWENQVPRSDGLEPLLADLPRSLLLGQPRLDITRSTSQELAWLSAEAFLKGGQQPEDWQAQWSGIWPNTNQPDSGTQSAWFMLETDGPPIPEVALLPMILFHHSDPKLWDRLDQILAHLSLAPLQVDRVQAFAWFIRQSLQQSLSPQDWLAQLLTDSKLPFARSTRSACHQGFQILHHQLSQPSSLETVAKSLATVEPTLMPLFWALYCFFTTPTQVRLSLLRACQTRTQPRVTVALVGAIAGAHNGTINIPIAWRLLLESDLQQPLMALIQQLFARWCGWLGDPSQELDMQRGDPFSIQSR